MTDVLFYHLTQSTLEQALPALLEKSVERGWNVVVQAGSEERRDALDAHLWVHRDDSFLAHGTDAEPAAGDQPVLLTTGENNANNAKVRFLVDGAAPPDLGPYERAVFMFDGMDNDQIEAARGHWKVLKAKGHAVTYWQQGDDGRWQKKA